MKCSRIVLMDVRGSYKNQGRGKQLTWTSKFLNMEDRRVPDVMGILKVNIVSWMLQSAVIGMWSYKVCFSALSPLRPHTYSIAAAVFGSLWLQRQIWRPNMNFSACKLFNPPWFNVHNSLNSQNKTTPNSLRGC